MAGQSGHVKVNLRQSLIARGLAEGAAGRQEQQRGGERAHGDGQEHGRVTAGGRVKAAAAIAALPSTVLAVRSMTGRDRRAAASCALSSRPGNITGGAAHETVGGPGRREHCHAASHPGRSPAWTIT